MYSNSYNTPRKVFRYIFFKHIETSFKYIDMESADLSFFYQALSLY